MDTHEWLDRREDTASIAGMARRLWESGVGYEDLQSELRQQYLVEALVANGGNQERTAEVLGVHRNTVYRAMHAVGLSVADAKELAVAVKESN